MNFVHTFTQNLPPRAGKLLLASHEFSLAQHFLTDAREDQEMRNEEDGDGKATPSLKNPNLAIFTPAQLEVALYA